MMKSKEYVYKRIGNGFYVITVSIYYFFLLRISEVQMTEIIYFNVAFRL